MGICPACGKTHVSLIISCTVLMLLYVFQKCIEDFIAECLARNNEKIELRKVNLNADGNLDFLL